MSVVPRVRTARPPVDAPGAALRGPQRHLALEGKGAIRYRPEISPFASIGSAPSAEDWAALAGLPGDRVALQTSAPVTPQAGWVKRHELNVLQMTGVQAVGGEPDAEIQILGVADVPEMLELARRTEPGPFLTDTIAFGGYVGIRRGGALTAMAGRRFTTPGWIEVSAVCTDPAHRGAGLGRRLVQAVVRGIRAEGAEPFLHVVNTNPARGLYEKIGFAVARECFVSALRRGS